MREPFTLPELGDVSPASQAVLTALKSQQGMVTNLERAMSAAPALLAAYARTMQLFGETSLSPSERQVVLLAVSRENDCGYCSAWHTAMAARAGLPPKEIDAIRTSRPMHDSRLEALRQYCLSLTRQHGHVSDADLQAFFAAGWTPQQAFEVIIGIGAKTLSNYASSLAQAPLDSVVKKFAIAAISP